MNPTSWALCTDKFEFVGMLIFQILEIINTHIVSKAIPLKDI